MPVGKRVLITVPPGVNKDDISYSATQYTNADKIRFYKGQPQKIGGWEQLNIAPLVGVPRSMFSWRDNTGTEITMIGTNARLYAYRSGVLTNITPLVTTPTAIANSLSTNYTLLATNNPVTVSVGSAIVTLTYALFTQPTFQVGDIISVGGVTGVTIGGIAVGDINGVHPVISVTSSTISFLNTSSTIATSSAIGGGNAVTLSTHVISVAQVAHGFSNGDRIKIAGAAGFNNYVAGDLNQEAIVRNQTPNAYDYYSLTADASGHFPNAAVSNAGGADTTVQGQIAAGICDFTPAEGFGGGNYGLGLYGQGSPFGTGYTLPTIWSFDRFGTKCIMTQGLQTPIYSWDGVITAAPILLTGSPPSVVNYVFTAGRQIIAFGAGFGVAGLVNQVTTNTSTSDGSFGIWSAASTNDVFTQAIPNVGRLMAHGYTRGKFILFAEDSVKAMNYVGGSTIWNITDVINSDGLLAPKACISINDVVVWVGQNNFYKYDGSTVSILPDNGLRQWFYDNLNEGAYYKTFIHKSIEYNELWIFFPFGSSSEPNAYIIWNFEEGHFTNGLLTRTASEIPVDVARAQYLATGSCDNTITPTLYLHEVDYTDNGSNMLGSLTTNEALLDGGDYLQYVDRIIPSTQMLPLGNTAAQSNIYQLTVSTKEYDGQPTARSFGAFQVDSTTQKIETRATGRQWKYRFDFNNTYGFRIEKFYAEVKQTTPR